MVTARTCGRAGRAHHHVRALAETARRRLRAHYGLADATCSKTIQSTTSSAKSELSRGQHSCEQKVKFVLNHRRDAPPDIEVLSCCWNAEAWMSACLQTEKSTPSSAPARRPLFAMKAYRCLRGEGPFGAKNWKRRKRKSPKSSRTGNRSSCRRCRPDLAEHRKRLAECSKAGSYPPSLDNWKPDYETGGLGCRVRILLLTSCTPWQQVAAVGAISAALERQPSWN